MLCPQESWSRQVSCCRSSVCIICSRNGHFLVLSSIVAYQKERNYCVFLTKEDEVLKMISLDTRNWVLTFIWTLQPLILYFSGRLSNPTKSSLWIIISICCSCKITPIINEITYDCRCCVEDRNVENYQKVRNFGCL